MRATFWGGLRAIRVSALLKTMTVWGGAMTIAGVGGCASIDVHRLSTAEKDGSKSIKGFPFYSPHPYLLVNYNTEAKALK